MTEKQTGPVREHGTGHTGLAVHNDTPIGLHGQALTIAVEAPARAFVAPPHLVNRYRSAEPDTPGWDRAGTELALALRWLGWDRPTALQAMAGLAAERLSPSRRPSFFDSTPEEEAQHHWRGALYIENDRAIEGHPAWIPVLGGPGAVQYLQAVAAQVERATFPPGRKGDSQRKLIRGMVQFALGLEEPKAIIGMDVRTMTDRCQVGESARSAALPELIRQGWLKPELVTAGAKRNREQRARRYLLRAPLQSPDLSRLELEEWCGCGPWSPSHPIWHGHGIAEPGRKMLRALQSGGPFESDADWYRAAGVNSPTTAKRWKSWLATGAGMGLPLVERSAAGWRLVSNVDEQMELLAVELGLVEKSENRAARHRRERIQYGSLWEVDTEPWVPDESDLSWEGGPFDENAVEPDDTQAMLLWQVGRDPSAAEQFLYPTRLECWAAAA